jgi:hypothetical protein
VDHVHFEGHVGVVDRVLGVVEVELEHFVVCFFLCGWVCVFRWG